MLNSNNRRISSEFIKFVENLIKIFTPEKFYDHFCVVATHFYFTNRKKMKEKIIEVWNSIFRNLFHDENKNFKNKFYFVNTEIDDEEENIFDEKSQEIIDIILKQIKLDIDFLGSIN